MENNIRLRPPYASSGIADSLLDLFRRLNPQKIDTKFIVDNKIATSPNAFTATDFLKWLGITDNNGKVNTEIVNKLKLVGEEREKFIRQLILKSYKELFNEINLEKARKEDIINYFVSHHQMGTGAAQYASSLFLHLCNKYSIPIAEELKKKSHKGRGRPKKKEENKSKKVGDETGKKIIQKTERECNPPTKGLRLLIKTPSTEFEKEFGTLSEFENFLKSEWETRLNSWKLDFPKEENETSQS